MIFLLFVVPVLVISFTGSVLLTLASMVFIILGAILLTPLDIKIDRNEATNEVLQTPKIVRPAVGSTEYNRRYMGL